MKLYLKILAGALPSAALLLLSALLLRRLLRRRPHLITPQTPLPESAPKSRFDSLQSSINKLRLSHKSASSARNSLRFHPLNHHHHHHHHHHHQTTLSSPFSWEDHPRLISEVMEAGWPRFAFSSSSSPRPSSSPLWSCCPACDGGAQRDPAAGRWDMHQGSSEFMQTVRLNPGPKKSADDCSFSWVRTSLPLPGPAAFPQEAYFEITILYLQPRKKLQETASRRVRDRESTDRSKLIRGNSISVMFSPQEPTCSAEKARSRSGDMVVSLGLINRAAVLSQSMPGSFAGSIGFHSDGSVFLDGRKLVFESEKAEWADVNRVIGCGFAPRKKKVFFTVDSELAHVIRCSSEEYSSPLYPALAADADAMILVNLGQVPFKYAPANATRTQNPCFVRVPSGSVEAEGCEHGKRSRLQNSNYSSSSKKSNGNLDDGLEAESDLFEISLQR